MSETPKKPNDPVYPFVLVINNEERLHTIHVPGKDGKPSETLLCLLPGVNMIDRLTLESCRKNPMFDAKFSSKIERHVAREAVSERVGEMILIQSKYVPEKIPLTPLTGEEALAIVADTTTEELLEIFLSGESRPEIRAAIDDRKRLLRTGSEVEAA